MQSFLSCRYGEKERERVRERERERERERGGGECNKAKRGLGLTSPEAPRRGPANRAGHGVKVRKYDPPSSTRRSRRRRLQIRFCRDRKKERERKNKMLFFARRLRRRKLPHAIPAPLCSARLSFLSHSLARSSDGFKIGLSLS